MAFKTQASLTVAFCQDIQGGALHLLDDFLLVLGLPRVLGLRRQYHFGTIANKSKQIQQLSRQPTPYLRHACVNVAFNKNWVDINTLLAACVTLARIAAHMPSNPAPCQTPSLPDRDCSITSVYLRQPHVPT
jgi:hypothetical protein